MTTAIILGGLAAAWLLWSRPAAPAGLPPLTPPPTPLALPAASAGSAAGPHSLTLLAIFAAGGMIAFAILESGKQPAPPAPAPVVGLDLRGRFVGPDAAADAATTAALVDELAEVIAYDGTQVEPRLRTGAAFDDLRRVAREMRTRGVSLGDRQPAVRDEIKRYLDAELGTDGGPVDAKKRSAWVFAFKSISQAAREASR